MCKGLEIYFPFGALWHCQHWWNFMTFQDLPGGPWSHTSLSCLSRAPRAIQFQAWLRPHAEGRLVEAFMSNHSQHLPPPKEKSMPFLVAKQFFHNKIPTAAGDAEISTACAVNKANTLTTAGLSVLDVAQSFRLETFSDAAFQSLGDWMMGLVLFFFVFGRIVIWMALKKTVVHIWFDSCMNVWFDKYIHIYIYSGRETLFW